MSKDIEISIIGAGISGLTVAHELVKRGFKVNVYEKDNEAGGMAKSKRTKENVPTEHSWRGYGPFYYNFFDIAKQIPTEINEGLNQYTLSEVQKHNTINDLWTIYKNNVYDITDYVSKHPGGSTILNCAGKDIEEVWNSMGYGWHANSSRIINRLESYKIGKLIESYTQKTVFDNLAKKKILFELLYNDGSKSRNPSLFDYIFIMFLFGKFFLSDKRRNFFFEQRLDPILKKNLSKVGYHYFADYLAGPGYGFDKNTMSVGHFALFVEYHLYASNWEWKVMNKPTSEAWIEPWVSHLKNLGVKFYFNHELKKISKSNDKINNLTISHNKKDKIITSNEYVIAINPFNLQDILLNGNFSKLIDNHIKINQVNNQISFRLGFDKKINMHVPNSGFVLIDSPYNITFYLQEDHWENVDLGMNGKIKTLISGTLIQTRGKGLLKGKSALELSILELKEEIVEQFFNCKTFVEQCKKSNVSKENIIFKEIYDEWFQDNEYLNTKNRKWVNNFINDKYRPSQITEYKNLFLSGSHCKTTINIWSMEGSVESGKLTTNLILDKYKVNKCYYYKHQSYPLVKLLGKIDNIFYNLHLKNLIIEILLIIILIYIKSKNMN